MWKEVQAPVHPPARLYDRQQREPQQQSGQARRATECT